MMNNESYILKSDVEGVFRAPVTAQHVNSLHFPAGSRNATLIGETGMESLFRARFDGPPPTVSVEKAAVVLNYKGYRFPLDWRKHAASITLNASIPWRIEVEKGAAEVHADLRGVPLQAISIDGGASELDLKLPRPDSWIPLKVAGGASEVVIRRPEDVPISIHVRGGATDLVVDDLTLGAVGRGLEWATPGSSEASAGYVIEIAGGATDVTITGERVTAA